MARLLLLRQSVSQGILHQRLQHEVRYQDISQLGGHGDVYREPVGESHSLDGEVALQEGQLVLEGNLRSGPAQPDRSGTGSPGRITWARAGVWAASGARPSPTAT
ncbi:MAG TPA: hypothetical protein VHR41_10005 [Gemmatimonadales bacterium]|nr:hypothetical protein [Gemmatimonadales bacterium]